MFPLGAEPLRLTLELFVHPVDLLNALDDALFQGCVVREPHFELAPLRSELELTDPERPRLRHTLAELRRRAGERGR